MNSITYRVALPIPLPLMMAALLICGCRSATQRPSVVDASANSSDQVVATAPAAAAILASMTYEDVPDKWRTTFVDQSTEAYQRLVFSRGTNRVLEVLWRRDWTDARSNMFTATVYDGAKRIASIMRFSNGGTSISQSRRWRSEYEMITTVREQGRASVLLTSETGYFQTIEVKGRDTQLGDDLDFTKTVLSMEQIGAPLLEAIDSQLKK